MGRRLLFAVPAVLLASLAALAAIEGGLRLFGGRPRIAPIQVDALRVSDNPILQYEYVPGYADARGGPAAERINALGFRDVEHAAAKPEGVRRVIVLGDSVVAGHGVALEETYTRRLEALLARRDRYETVAMAVPGYNTLQEAELLRTRGVALAPDVVIVGFSLNDFDIRSGIAASLATRLGREPPEVTVDWLRRSGVGESDARALAAAFRASDGALDLWLRGPKGDGAWERLALRTRLGSWMLQRAYAARLARMKEPEEPGDPNPGGVVGAGFDVIAGLAGERGFHVLVAITPLFGAFDSWDGYPEENETAHVRARNLAEDRGLAVLDLRAALSNAGGPKSLSVDPAHPNARGHEAIAGALAAELERRGW